MVKLRLGLVLAGSWGPILNKLTPFLNSTKTALQSVTVGIITIMAIYYQIRAVVADQQEEAMYTSRTKKVFVTCVIIFLVPTIVSVLKSFFG